MSPLAQIAYKARHVAFLFMGASALALARGRTADTSAPDRKVALVRALGARGLVVTADDVQWVDRPGGALRAAFGHARAIVRASPAQGEPADIFLVETRLTPEGVLLDVGSVYDLSDTTGADESRPVLHGERVAYVSKGLFEGSSTTVHVVDLEGQMRAGVDWTALERTQNAITNWQQTGQLRGVTKRTYAIDPPPKELSLGLDEAALSITADGRQGSVPLGSDHGAPPPWIRAESTELSRPGNLVTWSVDRVRAVSWIGDDTMQSIKAIAFTALDFVLRNKERVTGDTGAEGIAADLGKSELDPPIRSIPVDPEIGWPPPALEPFVTPVLPGEGQWNSLDADPFVRTNEGLPSAFLTTFIRTDPTRKATRVYVALWDPRQVELHMMAGTVEPKSASGEAGPGLIPRTPEVMKRVVAASNAGFQALHGEFGMMADGVVYLPPKPYAATVAVLRDGTTAFGTWPADPAIPDTVLSYRQNMTVMVQDEKFNPYGRTWWGGTVPGSEDKTHTVRTGICMTRESFVAYFYGADLSPDALSEAMIRTRCKFGIALDMNGGHAGLEFYKVAPAAELEPLGRPLHTDWEAEGDVPGLDGWRFRGRRLIRGMGLMHFPRYIKREGRDYFYMTLRHVLPGPAIGGAAGDGREPGKDGAWRVKGLPQHGFPYALAVTEVAGRPDARVRVLKIDPRTVNAAAPGKEASGETIAILDAGDATTVASARSELMSLWHSAGAFSIAAAPPVPEAVRLATAQGGPAVAAAGVHDEDGMLVYAELVTSARPAGDPPSGDAGTPGAAAGASSADAKMLDELLKKLGCGTRLLLAHPLGVALGGDTSLGGDAIRPPTGPNAIRLVRAQAAGAKRIFEDTPVVPFNVWYPLQQKRIRYFKKPEKAADATDADSK